MDMRCTEEVALGVIRAQSQEALRFTCMALRWNVRGCSSPLDFSKSSVASMPKSMAGKAMIEAHKAAKIAMCIIRPSMALS